MKNNVKSKKMVTYHWENDFSPKAKFKKVLFVNLVDTIKFLLIVSFLIILYRIIF